MNLNSGVSNSDGVKERRGIIKIAPICFVGPKRSINTHAFLDNRSPTTLIDERLAGSLGIESRHAKVNMRGLWDKVIPTKYQRVKAMALMVP